MRDPFTVHACGGSVVATAIHAGHDLRPEVEALSTLDEASRLREEDPFTDRFTAVAGNRVVVHRSRFEVDLNRARADAVYLRPEDAWGLDVCAAPIPADVVERSRSLHDRFYGAMADLLDEVAERGPFVVLDLHSYNHRRDGAGAPPDDPEGNPEVNVGTASLDRDRWGGLIDRFMDELAAAGAATLGRPLDVRENVRFKGGHLSRWVNDRWSRRGCALAVEMKKTFMDEWTGEVDADHVTALCVALESAVPGLLDEAGRAGP